MDNKIFRALSSKTRMEILRRISSSEKHLSGLARELNISVPVLSRHVKILEDAGLVKRKIVGNVHLLSSSLQELSKLLDCFVKEENVEINKGSSLFDALQQIPGVKIQRVGNSQYIFSIDNEEGYYVYEVNGIFPKIPIDKYVVSKNITVYLKKIVAVNRRKIDVKVKD